MKRIIAIALVLVMALTLCACDSLDYKKATELFNSGDYEEARAMFVELADYEDSQDMVLRCDYEMALLAMNDGEYESAAEQFDALGDYSDSKDMANECRYKLAQRYQENYEFKLAFDAFEALGDYKDSKDMAAQCKLKWVEREVEGEWREYISDALGTYFIFSGGRANVGIIMDGESTEMNVGNYTIDMERNMICVDYPATDGYAEFEFRFDGDQLVIEGVMSDMVKQ